MKYVASIAVLILIHAVNLSLQIPALKNCPSDFVLTSDMADSCGTMTCEKDGSFSQLSCGVWQCQPGRQIGYTETDNSKPFPDCCGGPICARDSDE